MKYVMSDARVFTSYSPDCQMNADIQKKYNLSNGNDYRYYLQNNAETLMKDFNNTKDNVLCPVCKSAIAYKPLGDIEFKQ